MTLEARFWAKVDRSGECWLWTAYVAPSGYGRIKVDGRLEYAHRVAFRLTTGAEAPDEVDHVCRNRRCVRPSHLRPATRKQNREHLGGAYAGAESPYRGVTRDRTRWRARVRHHGRIHNGGTFATPEEAAHAARALRTSLFTHNEGDRA